MRRCTLILPFLALAACGGEPTDSQVDSSMEPLDVRVPIPEPDDRYIDFVTQEVTIGAGEEKMFCQYMDFDFGDRLAARTMEMLQGQGGHHIVFLATSEPRPDGTLEDCTDAKDMGTLRPFVVPADLPPGHGVYLGSERQLVLQFHYVNTQPRPILVRDVARLEIMPQEDVTEWVSTFAANDALFQVGSGEEGRVEFDCEIQDDGVELMFVGGHLHEQGSFYEVKIGPDVDNLESVYLVDPYKPEYRDSPPITFYLDDPKPLPKGTIMRTECRWNNELDHEVDFPEEMCVTFGYLKGVKQPWICDTGGVFEDTGGFTGRRSD